MFHEVPNRRLITKNRFLEKTGSIPREYISKTTTDTYPEIDCWKRKYWRLFCWYRNRRLFCPQFSFFPRFSTAIDVYFAGTAIVTLHTQWQTVGCCKQSMQRRLFKRGQILCVCSFKTLRFINTKKPWIYRIVWDP